MPQDTREMTLFSPATIAIHDNREMYWYLHVQNAQGGSSKNLLK
jgi:hypothetical protein